MVKDYEKIGREFMDISNRYDEATKNAECPREAFSILDRFYKELHRLWQENR